MVAEEARSMPSTTKPESFLSSGGGMAMGGHCSSTDMVIHEVGVHGRLAGVRLGYAAVLDAGILAT